MISFYPLLPWWVILPASAVAIWLVWHTARGASDLDRRRRMRLAALRLSALALVVIMLLGPGIVIREIDRQRSNVVFLLDGSGSMKTRDMAGGHSRFEDALGLLEQLRRSDIASCRTHSFMFNSDAVPIDDLETLKNFGADGGTDFKRALQTVDRKIGLNAVAAVVILSDGIDNSGFSGLHTGVPVFAVRFGTELENVPDLRLEPFKLPDSVRTGEEINLDIPVVLAGVSRPVATEVKIFADDRQVKAEKLQLEPGKPGTVKFRHLFTSPGMHTLRIDCGRIENETSYLNNSRELAIEVRDGGSETLCFFPILNSTLRPLLRLLKDTGSKFTACYRLGDRQWQVIGAGDDKALRYGLPKAGELLRRFDVIILGAGGNGLTSAEETALEQYAANGGNLIVLGGPDAYGGSGTSSPLAAALPVKVMKSTYLPGSFRVIPPENGENQFAAAIGELCSGNTAILRGVNTVDSVRGGAEVLLRAEDASRRRPLVVAAPYGRGRVIAVLTSSLHLWGDGGTRKQNFGTFWKQLLGYAGKSREELLTVSVNSTEPLPGDTLQAKASVNLAEIGGGEPKLEAALYPAGAESALSVMPMTASGSIYTADFPHLAKGRYVLKVTCRAGGRELAVRYRLILCGDRIMENYELKSTADKFTHFTTAGRVYTPEEKRRLLDDLIGTVQKNDVMREWFPVFNTPLFFLALTALLLTEWYLRRRYNLF